MYIYADVYITEKVPGVPGYSVLWTLCVGECMGGQLNVLDAMQHVCRDVPTVVGGGLARLPLLIFRPPLACSRPLPYFQLVC